MEEPGRSTGQKRSEQVRTGQNKSEQVRHNRQIGQDKRPSSPLAVASSKKAWIRLLFDLV